MGFRDNLKELIEYQGMLVKELAAKTGIKKQTLDSYLREKSYKPSAENAVKIAQALGTTVEYLVTGREAKGKAAPQIIAELRRLDKALAPLPDAKRKIVIRNAVSLADMMR